MAPDLYAALGVSRDALPPEIRRAYRKAAKRAHPDGGGSSKQFAVVRLAHDTLMDDARRAKYDQTGEIEDKPVDNRQTEIMQIISMCLDQAMADATQRGKEPKQVDLVRGTKEKLRQYRQQSLQQKAEFEKNMARSKELIGRFSTAEAQNVMEALLIGRVSACQTEIAKRENQVGLLDAALELLDHYAFRAEEVPMPTAVQPNYANYLGSMLGIGTSTRGW